MLVNGLNFHFSARLVIACSILWYIGMGLVSLRMDSNTQDLNEWLPGGSEKFKRYESFVEQFGTDDFVLVSWDGCTLDDPRLNELEGLLNDPRENNGLIRSATSGKTMVERMVRSGRTRRSSINRLKNIYFGPDRKTTCLTIQLSEAGNLDRRSVINRLPELVEKVPGLLWDDIYLTGPCYFAVQIDRETNRSTMFALPACVVGSLLTWFFVRKLRLVFPILFTSSLAGINGLGLMVLCGAKMNGILVLMPAFVIILTMAGCIHVVNYFVDELRTHDWESAVTRAMRIAVKPCTFSTLTTTIALFSLCTSNIPAVKAFGFYTAISLLVGLGMLFVVLPSWLLLFASGQQVLREERSDTAARWLSVCWQRPAVRNFLLIVSLACAVMFSAGLYRADSALSTEKMFLEKSQVLKSANWFRENICGASSVELLLEIDSNEVPKIADQIDIVWSMQKPLMKREDTTSTFSIANFFGPLPPKSKLRNLVRRASIESRLNENLGDLKKSRFFADTGNRRNWKIRIGLGTTAIDEYEQVIQRLQEHADEIKRNNPAIKQVSFTGMNYLAVHSQERLFSELARSFGLAFLIITPVMMVVLRGVIPGLISMIPNVAPALIVFGGMGLLSIPITVGAILTATVGLGIAVDDTLHFLCWFRDYNNEAHSASTERATIVDRVVAKCIRPMSQTSIICGLSLLCFVPVHFIPVRQFSVTIGLLLAMALICDLVLLPLLLASPIGRLFGSRKRVVAGKPRP